MRCRADAACVFPAEAGQTCCRWHRIMQNCAPELERKNPLPDDPEAIRRKREYNRAYGRMLRKRKRAA